MLLVLAVSLAALVFRARVGAADGADQRNMPACCALQLCLLTKPTRRTPMRERLQSYLVATDQVGLDLLLQDSQVFACFENMHDTIYHSELGSSKLILDAGFNIDSLMVRACMFRG